MVIRWGSGRGSIFVRGAVIRWGSGWGWVVFLRGIGVVSWWRSGKGFVVFFCVARLVGSDRNAACRRVRENRRQRTLKQQHVDFLILPATGWFKCISVYILLPPAPRSANNSLRSAWALLFPTCCAIALFVSLYSRLVFLCFLCFASRVASWASFILFILRDQDTSTVGFATSFVSP